MAKQQKRLGEILVEWGIISAAEVARALEHAKSKNMRMGEALIDLKLASDHLFLSLGIEPDVARNHLAQRLGSHQLSDPNARRRRIVGDNSDVAFAWRDFRATECERQGIVGQGREALESLDFLRTNPNWHPSPHDAPRIGQSDPF